MDRTEGKDDEETRAASGATAANGDGHREADEHRPTRVSESSSQRSHFEETLTRRNKKTALVVFAGILVLPTIIATVIIPWNSFSNVAVVVGTYALVGVLFWILLRGIRAEAHVRVTDTGVEAELTPEPLIGNVSSAVVPFEDITRVQYSEPSGGHIHVTNEDQWEATREADNPRTFMVTSGSSREFSGTYRGGIRIEQADGPPVYIGSERPVELATAIVDRAGSVETADRI